MLKKIIDAEKYLKEIIKAKIISAEGSVPRNIDTFMLISKYNIFGSIGGGQLEHQITKISRVNLDKKDFENEILNIPLGPSIGQCCGGYVQIKIEKYKNGKLALASEQKNNLINEINSTKVPVCVVWGKEDQIIPSNHHQVLNDRIKIIIEKDCGHMAHIEKPSVVNDAINSTIVG